MEPDDQLRSESKMCWLCRETRGLQRCHVIPRKFTKPFANLQNFRVIILCPSHHWYFDHDKLYGHEIETLKPYVMEGLSCAVDIYKIARPIGNHIEVIEAFKKHQTYMKQWIRSKYEVYNV